MGMSVCLSHSDLSVAPNAQVRFFESNDLLISNNSSDPCGLLSFDLFPFSKVMDLLMDIVGKVGEDERPVNDFSVSYEEDGEEEMLDD